MASVFGDVYTWSGSRDKEGHRSYSVTHIVKSTISDGPRAIMNASGLPVAGVAIWAFGGDSDPYAFCYPTMKIKIHKEKKGEINRYWQVTQEFSTKPINRCQDDEIEEPWLQAPKVSGTFNSTMKVPDLDRNGIPIRTVSHEKFRGPNAEFPHTEPGVRIEINQLALDLNVLAEAVNSVNSDTMFGLEPRKVLLANTTWEQKIYGTCVYYYTIVYDFTIDYDGFDRILQDEGSKVLRGDWIDGVWFPDMVGDPPVDIDDPSHFQRFQDVKGNITRTGLKEDGTPSTSLTPGHEDAAKQHTVEYYPETNFLQLNLGGTKGTLP